MPGNKRDKLGKEGSNYNIFKSKSGITPPSPEERIQYTSNTATGNKALANKSSNILDRNDVSNIIGLHPAIKYDQSFLFPDSEIEIEHQKMILSRTPIVDIYPAKANLGSAAGGGMQIISLDENKGGETFKKLLSGLKGLIPDKYLDPPIPLRFAVQADSLQTSDSFSNTYGQSMFESILSAESTLGSNIAALYGTSDVGELSNRILGGDMMEKLGINNIKSALQNQLPPGSKTADILSRLVNTAASLILGARVDYPSIWQGSAYQCQHQFTVRLYNLNMGDYEGYVENIVIPIAYLLSLTLPISTVKSNEADPFTFSFPLLIRARCGGLFYVPAGYISNIQILKGGDTNDIAWHEQPGIVDVVVSIDSLYDTMVAYEFDDEPFSFNEDVDRPTLNKYISNMIHWVDFGEIEPEKKKEEEKEKTKKQSESKFKKSLKSIKNAIKSVKNAINKVANTALAVVGKVTAFVSSPITALGSVVNKFGLGVTDLIGTANGVSNFVSAITFGKVNLSEKLQPTLNKLRNISSASMSLSENLLGIGNALKQVDNVAKSGASVLGKLNSMTQYFRDVDGFKDGVINAQKMFSDTRLSNNVNRMLENFGALSTYVGKIRETSNKIEKLTNILETYSPRRLTDQVLGVFNQISTQITDLRSQLLALQQTFNNNYVEPFQYIKEWLADFLALMNKLSQYGKKE